MKFVIPYLVVLVRYWKKNILLNLEGGTKFQTTFYTNANMHELDLRLTQQTE